MKRVKRGSVSNRVPKEGGKKQKIEDKRERERENRKREEEECKRV